MRGGFQGEWWTESRWADSLGKPLAIALAAIAVVSWLATILLALAIILGIVLALGLGGIFVLRRTSDRDRELLGARAAAVRAEAEAGRQITAPKPVTVINVAPGAHVHLTPGATVAGSIRPPVPGAVIREEGR